ncbi:hypothetical protein [Dongia sp.]|uniref:hypothetical protein n=1 Tax=Dongia sp. TaxID=1977262 RepID=UPI0035B2EC44
MTISTTLSRITYAGDGLTVNFAVPFIFFGADEIDVIERSLASGAEAQKILSSDYTVSGGNGAGGTVTAASAPGADKSWTIARRTNRTQMVDYTPNDPFPAETHERALDRLTALVQELDDKVGRSASLSPTSPAASITLPDPEAGRFLSWKSDLSGLENRNVPAGTTVYASISTARDGVVGNEAVTPLALAALWRKGSDIGSAATLAKPSDAGLGGYHLVTGTTSIAALWTGEAAGAEVELRFSAALTLIHNVGSLILPGGANVTATAGDVARFRCEGSNVWRCVSGPPGWFGGAAGGVSLPVGTKTTSYTMLAADRGGEIQFTTAGATLSLLPAATAGNGAALFVRNAAASGDVTIDPNGSETLDGLATRALRPGDRVLIRSDGANWATVLGEYSYTTAEVSIAIGTASVDAHGLGGLPDRIKTIIRCKTADLGYGVGDEVEVAYAFYNGYESNNVQISANATNLRASQGATRWWIAHATTGAVTLITPASWKLVVKAWRK